MRCLKSPQDKDCFPHRSQLVNHPVLQGKLADVLADYSLVEGLRSLRLVILDYQLQQLWQGENSTEVEQLVEQLGSAIQLAALIDLQKGSE